MPRPRPTTASPSATPTDVRQALDAFRHIVQALRAARADTGRPALGSAQLFALQRIAEHPGSSVNDVAALTFTHQSSVSVVIQRLVEQGYVARVASDTDRRRQQLAVTAKGRRLLARAPSAAQGDLIAAIASLPDRERRAFAASLTAVARMVTPSRPGQHPPMFFEERPRNTRRSTGSPKPSR